MANKSDAKCSIEVVFIPYYLYSGRVRERERGREQTSERICMYFLWPLMLNNVLIKRESILESVKMSCAHSMEIGAYFFLSVVSVALKFDYESHIIYYFSRREKKEPSTQHITKSIKTNTISTAFTIEVTSEVFAYCVLCRRETHSFVESMGRER